MKTVFVGLSGGVDSAVSAYLLKRQGHKVVGVFIKAWEPDFLPCTSGSDRLDAMRIAAHLEIPFKTYDLGEEYKREVVDYLLAEYRAGRTPNPDVMCNRTIKFGAFSRRAQADGADMIATGHYAQIQSTGDSLQLTVGKDVTKDQSYFLWTLTQDDLSHTLFPVGGMLKSKVREIAQEAGLPNATKRDSQGLCFLGHVDMKEFLMRMLPAEPDDVRLYTIGEKVNGKYVVEKDITTNSLVTVDHPAQSGSTTFTLGNVNWIAGAPTGSVTAQIRYHGEKLTCSLQLTDDRWIVRFHKSVLAALGQSLVVYDGDVCMGGGIIDACQ